ncbi:MULTISPECIES: MAPEG family protein [Asticcacaulis]|uniref:MAPEG family protein n=1 Tax=Asticcacaulis TaxID=76890 RepID=UPI001AE9DA4F|nr:MULTISPECIES: MAPEG family protein [Asticcacaulis]MBP2160955.1 hypothetical protein [Asticcacaulis solisilvae]MDR6801841.1 hypothetical protein [Asticcacaulis sp. BE141]
MLEKHLILWPVAAMAALTFIVLNLMPFARVIAVRTGKARVSDFKYGEAESVPETARLINRNYMNLLELPVLFYVVCLILFADDAVTQIELILAWLFVGFRAAHTVLHLTINHVLVRLSVFALAVITLLALWIVTFWRIAGL